MNAPKRPPRFPNPPPHYKRVFSQSLPPPPIPEPDTELRVFDYPLFETYRSQFEQLETMVTILYDKTANPAQELKKLTHSILFCYFRLVKTLVVNPTEAEGIKETMYQLFLNMHHLLNSYRPHQARQTLVAIMEAQIRRRTEFLASVERRLEKSREILRNVALVEGGTLNQKGFLEVDNEQKDHENLGENASDAMDIVVEKQ